MHMARTGRLRPSTTQHGRQKLIANIANMSAAEKQSSVSIGSGVNSTTIMIAIMTTTRRPALLTSH